MNLGDAALLSLIGIAIVFAVLVVLMVIIMVMGKISSKSESVLAKMKSGNKAEEETEAVQSTAEPVAAGTCGDLLLVKTEERDAAMIMAIVADATETPLNELRFKSIKRIDEE